MWLFFLHFSPNRSTKHPFEYRNRKKKDLACRIGNRFETPIEKNNFRTRILFFYQLHRLYEGYIFQDGYCYTKQQAKELRIKKRGEMLEAIAGALDEQREYDLEREKLDLERFRIMSPQKYEFYIND